MKPQERAPAAAAAWSPLGAGGGAVAGDPGWPPEVAAAAQQQDLGPELLQLAWELASLAPPGVPGGRRAVLLLALAALAAERSGSARLPLAAPVLEPFLGSLGASPADLGAVAELLAAARRVVSPGAVAAAVPAAGDGRRGALPGAATAGGADLAGPAATATGLQRLFGGPGDYRPLLLAAEHLYTQRAWQLERRVAGRLRELLAAPSPAEAAAVEAALADVRARPPRGPGGAPMALSAEQEAAVRTALGGRLTAITGGPGTGKTWILAALLRVVARLGEPPLPLVALAAPTGKAADRIRASLLAALRAVGDPAPADLALLAAPPAASTLHRLLSYSPAGERFRHHERNPLGERLVLVDESSMMDLALADHLLRSLPEDGRLVLLGDAQQLPSVEAGAVLRELVDAPAAAPRVARLRHSFRMSSGDAGGRAILELAARVASGDLGGRGGAACEEGGSGGTATTALRRHEDAAALAFTGVELLSVPPASLAQFLTRWWRERVAGDAAWGEAVGQVWPLEPTGFDAALTASLAGLFRRYEASRLLTATRGWSGGTGAAAANSWCRAALARELGLGAAAGRAALAGGGEPLPGEPVLVTRNDYRRGLYNGDQGLVLAIAPAGAAPAPMAVFRDREGFRAFPPAALRGRLEPGWATTVHKAQGSEHEVVALVLPAGTSRLLTRELLYTAITRARRGVVLVGSEEVLRQAAATASERWSGLGEQLAGVAPAAARAEPTAGPRRQLALPF